MLYVFNFPKSIGYTERCYQFVITSLLSIKDSRNILISVDHSIDFYILIIYFVDNYIIFPYRIFIICPKADVVEFYGIIKYNEITKAKEGFK